MPSHVLLWPALLYVGAAILLPRLHRWLSPAAQRYAVLLAAALGMGVTLLLLVSSGAGRGFSLPLWEGIGQGLNLRLDAFGALFLRAVALLALASALASLDESAGSGGIDDRAGMLVVVAGIGAMALAANLLTLLLAHLLLLAGLLFGVGLAGRARWLLVVMAQGILTYGLLLLAALVLWRGGTVGGLTGQSTTAAWLLLLAGTVQMAPLPLSFFAVPFEPLPGRILSLLPVATLGAGTLLLARLADQPLLLAQMDLRGIAALGALAAALAGWVAWRRQERSVRLMMLSAGQAGWVLWVLGSGRPAEAIAVGLSGALALGVLGLFGNQRPTRLVEGAATAVASLLLLAVPGSALWSGATLASGIGWRAAEPRLLLLPALGVLALMGSAVALLDWHLGEQAPGRPYPARGVGALLLAAVALPPLWPLWGLVVPAIEGQPAGPLAARLTVPVLGWAGALLLWRIEPLLGSLRNFLDGAADTFSFIWLWRVIGRIGWLLLSALRGMALIVEGENYGWLLLFLFVTLVFLLQ